MRPSPGEYRSGTILLLSLLTLFLMMLRTRIRGEIFEIDLPEITDQQYGAVNTQMRRAFRRQELKNRDVICEAFLWLLQACPGANASDLWHHIVYRLYCQLLPRYRPQDPNQSWVRASGDALELSVERLYAPVLALERIRIQALIGRAAKRSVLEEMNLGEEVGDSKLDVALRLETGRDHWQIFGGVHVKASLAERVSDDVPASRSMMRRGLFSPLWTLDVKSFPPPHGDLINRGELGTTQAPTEKRRYVEDHGEFDNCYSANGRTSPSVGNTRSGKRIQRLDLIRQPDSFAEEVITRARRWRRQ